MENNWRELPAGLELDIIIAKVLGYTAKREVYTINPHYNPSEHFGVAIYNPSGERLTHWNSYPDHEQAEYTQWAKAIGMAHHEYDDAPIDSFSSSVDAALVLIADLPYRINARTGYRINVMINPRDMGWTHEDDAYGEGDTVALAICRAWLEYNEKSKSLSVDL